MSEDESELSEKMYDLLSKKKYKHETLEETLFRLIDANPAISGTVDKLDCSSTMREYIAKLLDGIINGRNYYLSFNQMKDCQSIVVKSQNNNIDVFRIKILSERADILFYDYKRKADTIGYITEKSSEGVEIKKIRNNSTEKRLNNISDMIDMCDKKIESELKRG